MAVLLAAPQIRLLPYRESEHRRRQERWELQANAP